MEAQPPDPYATLGVPRTATPQEIRKAYLKLVREHPPESEPEAFARINDAYAILGNAEKRAAFDAAPVWPADAMEAAKEAFAAAQAERFDDACRTLEPVVAKHPGFEPLERLYGQTLLGAERYADALPIWRRAVDARPDDVGALYALGAAVGAGGKGDMEEAVRLLKRAITLAPDDPECAIGLGRTYLRMGRAEDAAAAFARGMERHPEPGPARLAFRIEILRGARFLQSADGAAEARAKLGSELAAAEEPVRRHALARLWGAAVAFQREGRLLVAAALLDDFAAVGPAGNPAAGFAAFLREAAACDAESARLRADDSHPPWLKAAALAASTNGPSDEQPSLAEFVDELRRVPAMADVLPRVLQKFGERYPKLLERLRLPLGYAMIALHHADGDPTYFAALMDPQTPFWIKSLAACALSAGDDASQRRRRVELVGFLRGNSDAAHADFSAFAERHADAAARMRDLLARLRRGEAEPAAPQRPPRRTPAVEPTAPPRSSEGFPWWWALLLLSILVRLLSCGSSREQSGPFAARPSAARPLDELPEPYRSRSVEPRHDPDRGARGR